MKRTFLTSLHDFCLDFMDTISRYFRLQILVLECWKWFLLTKIWKSRFNLQSPDKGKSFCAFLPMFYSFCFLSKYLNDNASLSFQLPWRQLESYLQRFWSQRPSKSSWLNVRGSSMSWSHRTWNKIQKDFAWTNMQSGAVQRQFVSVDVLVGSEVF